MEQADGKSSSSCTWKRIVILVIFPAIVAAALIYFFAPVDRFNGNDESPTETFGGDNDTETAIKSDVPSAAPTSKFEFNQCVEKNDLDVCCNGLDGICGLGVDEILWATSHNAMGTREGGYFVGYNHLYELEGSLEAGYRALSLDVCNCGGEYQLCHGVCTFGARSPTEVFNSIVKFLDDNPTEVIMINLQVASEVSDEVSLDAFAASLAQNVPGFTERLHVHEDKTAPWPTLGTLTASNQVRRNALARTLHAVYHVLSPTRS